MVDCVYIFDFDKTLVDLPVDIERVRADVLALMKKHGVKGPPRPLLGVLNKMKIRGGVALRHECENIIKQGEVDASVAASKMFGLSLLDEALEGAVWAVLTNNNSEVVIPTLRRFMNNEPCMVVGRDHVEEAKPSPEGLRKVALKNPARSYVMIGDSESDRLASQNCPELDVRFWGVGEVFGHQTLEDIAAKMRAKEDRNKNAF